MSAENEFLEQYEKIDSAHRTRIREAEAAYKQALEAAKEKRDRTIRESAARREREQALLAQAFAENLRRGSEELPPLGESPTTTDEADTPSKLRPGEVDTAVKVVLPGLDEITGPKVWKVLNARDESGQRYTRSTVRGALQRLEKAGVLEVSDPGGRGPSNPKTYRLRASVGGNKNDEEAVEVVNNGKGEPDVS